MKKARRYPKHPGLFDKEADNLKKAREFKSPHIIKPIAAYTVAHNGDQCLIFPWADGGNLIDYWVKFSQAPHPPNRLRWIINQVVGLSSALEESHEINMRHGDLKPENILWFKQDNGQEIFQIADLGLATFHQKELNTGLRINTPTITPPGTSRYEPPETDEQRSNKKPTARSRAYDVWSMGCILLELLLWLLGGYRAVEDLKSQTAYFWKEAPGRQRISYEIHPEVVVYMDHISEHATEDTVYRDLLHVIRTRLLVVRAPISEDYKSSPGCREIASELHKTLRSIQQKCENRSPTYLAPLQLPPFPIKVQQPSPSPGIVHERYGALVPPRTKDALAASQNPLPSTTSDSNDFGGGKILVRKATEDLNPMSLMTTSSTAIEQQQVSDTTGRRGEIQSRPLKLTHAMALVRR